ncbi:MAG: outer membrane protein assembly factor BamA, partial [Candidatus Omnitrophica bacterium]|nr:outer membrane protein assembly factor BamA [Candidatus Omnitrophota bacterium]
LQVTVDEGRKRIIQAINFEGVYWLKPKDVLKRIETKSAKWWFVKGLLKEDVLDLDLERIRAMYDEEGFSDATVTYRLEDTNKPDQIILTFVVDEGRQYLVGDVTFEGNNLFSREEILDAIELKPDSPFSRRGLRKSVSNIQDLYFGIGYMNAKVIFDSFYNDKSGRVDSVYKIKEGEITYVDRVIVRGNSKTKDVVIRRELRVYPGEPFDGTALKKSKQRLFNLGFFEEVQFDTVDTTDPNRKNLVVTVKETKTGEFSFGGGFSSIDRVVGFVQIRQKNFDHAKPWQFTGAGQDLAMRVQLGSVRSQGELSWTDPWFMGQPYSVGFDLYKREFDRTRSSGLFFDEDRIGAKIRLGKDLNDNDRLSLSYTIENVEIGSIPSTASADLRAEEGENNLSRLNLLFTRDFRDNRFVPSEGYMVQAGAEMIGGFLGGDKDFWRATFLAAKYYPIDFIDSVFEVKGRLGISDEFDDTPKVPIFERFYAGGANTIRGYEERRIGPRDAGTNDPIGGETYWVVNGELTFPLVEGIIKGAAFYDVGAVDDQLDNFGSGDIVQGIGLGVRLKTPIGPVKIDMGYPLNDVPGEDKDLQFYFNMSRGF